VLIYKILRLPEWAEFETSGTFEGSVDDRRDGFIHCSSRSQVEATALRFFADQEELIVLALDVDGLEGTVRWEPASSGELFPHVYAVLLMQAVVMVHHVGGASAVDAALGTD
jgi:uncharacterized protein (DUF952 family)